MNIFDSQENIFNFEDRFSNFANSCSQFDFVFNEERTELSLQMWDYMENDFCEQESFRNNRSTNENFISANNDWSSNEWVSSITPFVEGDLDVSILQKLVNFEILKKGYNSTVLECLDMWLELQSDDESSDIIRKKQPKSRAQIKALKVEYKKKKIWSKKSIKNISKKLGLTEYQVYKWHWDHSNKQTKTQNKRNKRT